MEEYRLHLKLTEASGDVGVGASPLAPEEVTWLMPHTARRACDLMGITEEDRTQKALGLGLTYFSVKGAVCKRGQNQSLLLYVDPAGTEGFSAGQEPSFANRLGSFYVSPTALQSNKIEGAKLRFIKWDFKKDEVIEKLFALDPVSQETEELFEKGLHHVKCEEARLSLSDAAWVRREMKNKLALRELVCWMAG